ncbi:hypothetical protein B0H63DRAFT_467769 [Podospora didyma]|uniref:Uncharacterized protein n=1 Tax=Podospora didyma TaxID=330526 RepID=A0AAE0U0G4_9PEZI|nr:hypothetical protein B0H63DRAFT_467769 [Podospora didyma]
MAEPNQYPGWKLDLRCTDQVWDASPGVDRSAAIYPMGIHPNCRGGNSEMLLVREVAMMLVMDRLTDKPAWHEKVFDDEIADKWRSEALAWPNADLWERIANLPHHTIDETKPPKHILSKECVDFCIEELRHKAKYFKKTGIIPTLDATFSIAKSDVIVPTELRDELRNAFARLQKDQASRPDWHPNTNETVQDLVHPSMYPLVYGRSRFIDDEVVGVEGAIDKWAGKGEVIPRQPEAPTQPRDPYSFVYNSGGTQIDPSYWSSVYQWLPANFEFTEGGGVAFTSYINNLHPVKYFDIYETIERLVEKALPMWDQCLVQYQEFKVSGAGRYTPRMVPSDPDDETPGNWDPPSVAEMLLREAAAAGFEMTAEEAEEAAGKDAYDYELNMAPLDDRWKRTRDAVQIEPPPFSQKSRIDYKVAEDKALRVDYKDCSLQVIVKMASIELTPEKPEFTPGGWHVEGMMNEHIVATAIYYLDSENITESHLDFRTMVREDQDEWDIGQDGFHWMERSYGAKLGAGSGSPCLQHYGSVITSEGRLLAFPNVFHHRVSGFKLTDPTKPGHRRFIALWLVDPLTRIISTANVPPQQAEWWEDRAFGDFNKTKDSTMPPEVAHLLVERGLGGGLGEAIVAGKLGGAKLPAEVLDMVRSEIGNDDGLPMTREEAEEHRRKLMEERSAFQGEASRRLEGVEYSFCEH